MKVVPIFMQLKRAHIIFYREHAVDKPRRAYEGVFYNFADEWTVTVFDPNKAEVKNLFGVPGTRFESLSDAIIAADDALTKLTEGE